MYTLQVIYFSSFAFGNAMGWIPSSRRETLKTGLRIEIDPLIRVRLDRACVPIHTRSPFCMKELSYEDANNIFRCTDHHFMGAEPIRIAIRGRLPKLVLVYGHRFRLRVAPREARSYRRATYTYTYVLHDTTPYT